QDQVRVSATGRTAGRARAAVASPVTARDAGESEASDLGLVTAIVPDPGLAGRLGKIGRGREGRSELQGPFGGGRLRLRPAGSPADAPTWGVTPSAKTVAAIVGVLWAIVLVLILRHRVFVSHDSISNYGHVWWVSDRLWSGDGLPFRMPIIGHGKA